GSGPAGRDPGAAGGECQPPRPAVDPRHGGDAGRDAGLGRSPGGGADPLRAARGMRITLCTSCALGRGGFAAVLGEALAAEGIAAGIATTDCLSGCARPSSLAFRAPGKTAYL